MTQLLCEKPELFKGRHFNHLLIIQAVFLRQNGIGTFLWRRDAILPKEHVHWDRMAGGGGRDTQGDREASVNRILLANSIANSNNDYAVNGCIARVNAERLVCSRPIPTSQSETRSRLIAAAVARC
jgi:hypothetical protein